MGPSLSMLHESAIAPVRGTRPNDGRSPVEPQRVDGEEIEPNVSDPRLKATHPAAVAEAGAAGEAHAARVVVLGVRVVPRQHESPPAEARERNFGTVREAPTP